MKKGINGPMKYSLLSVAAVMILISSFAYADISPAPKLDIRMTSGSSTLVFDFGPSQLNGTLTGGATYNSTNMTVQTNGLTGYVRINTSAAAFACANGTASVGNCTWSKWIYTSADDGTNDFIHKIGAGTPMMQSYCQWSSSNNMRTDTWNSTGTNEFFSSGLACLAGQWQMFTWTIDSNGLTRTYSCTQNGSISVGNTWTPSGGKYRTPSVDAVLYGDASNSVNGSLGAIRFYNVTLGPTDIQALCEQDRNFVADNFSMSINASQSLGTSFWKESAGIHTGWAVTNVTAAYNSYPGRVDINPPDGSEDTNITQAAYVNTKQALENISSSSSCYEMEASLESIFDSAGVIKNTQSNYANVGHQKQVIANANAESRCVIIETNYMVSAFANTTDGMCTGTSKCFPVSYSNWGQFVTNYTTLVGCGLYNQSDGTSICEISPWNEWTLSQFLANNVTSNRQTNTTYLNKSFTMFNAVYTAMDALPYTMKKWSPSFADARDNSEISLRRQFMGNFTGRNIFIDFDLYHFAWNGSGTSENFSHTLNTSITSIQLDCTTYSFNCSKIRLGEWGTYNSSNQNATKGSLPYKKNSMDVAEAMEYIFNSLYHIRMETSFFEFACNNVYSNGTAYLCGTGGTASRFMSVIELPQVNTTSMYLSPYPSLWQYTTFHDYNSTVISCNSGNAYVGCSFSLNASGEYYVTFNNKGYAQRIINLSTFSVPALQNLSNVENSSKHTFTSNVTSFVLQPLTSQTYKLEFGDAAGPALTVQSPTNTTYTNATINVTINATDPSEISSYWMSNGTNNFTLTPLGDKSGNGKNLQIGNASYNSSGFYSMNGLSTGGFVGSSSGVSPLIGNNGSMTMSIWFLRAGSGGGNLFMKVYGSVQNCRSGSILLTGTNALQLCMVNSSNGGQSATTSNNIYTTGVWTHALATYNNSTGNASIYVNGVLSASTTVLNGLTASSTTNLYFGTEQNTGSPAYINGSFDNAHVWNRTLSAAEIAADYANQSVKDGLVAWWDFSPNGTGSFQANQGSNTWTFYANDTLGNLNSTTVSFSVNSSGNSAPVVSTVVINGGANVSINDDLVAVCNATDADGNNLNYTVTWWNGSTVYDTYNVSSYSLVASPNSYSIVDDDVMGYVYLNYSGLSKGDLMEVLHGAQGVNWYNTTIPSSCIASTTQLRVRSIYYDNQSYYPGGLSLTMSEPQCLSGSQWLSIGYKRQSIVYSKQGAFVNCGPFATQWGDGASNTATSYVPDSLVSTILNGTGQMCDHSPSFLPPSSTANIYEVRVWTKNNSAVQGVNTTVGYIRNSGSDLYGRSKFAHAQNWTVSCMASDGLVNSSIVNSTVAFINDTVAPTIDVSGLAFTPSSPSARQQVDFTLLAFDSGVLTPRLQVTKGGVSTNLTPTFSAYTYAGDYYVLTYTDTETAGSYDFILSAVDAAGNTVYSNITSFVISGLSGSSGTGGRAPRDEETTTPPTDTSNAGGSTEPIKVINTSFAPEIPRINSYLFLTGTEDLGVSGHRNFEIFTNRVLKSCEVSHTGYGTPPGAFTCSVNGSTLIISIDVKSARVPLSTTFDAEIIAYSTNDEAMKVPVKLTVISLITTDENEELLIAKLFIMIGGTVGIIYLARKIYTSGTKKI